MYKGKIAIIKRNHGYGFIETDLHDRIFFHQRWLQGLKFRDLKEGDRVRFDINMGSRGPRAYNLRKTETDVEELIEV